MIRIICKNCSKPFRVQNYRADTAKYCCKECRQASQAGKKRNVERGKVTIKCEICDNTFEIEKYRADTAKYCSRRCLGQSLLLKETRICKHCNKEFPVSRTLNNGSAAGMLFCSIDCKSRHQRKRIVIRCRNCKKPMEVPVGDVNHGRRYCSKKCMRERAAYLISVGKGPPPKKSKYKQGYYVSKITKERNQYDSSYELARMIELDNKGIKWTKNHGIVIKYRFAGRDYFYVPDFKVEDNVLEEIKGSWRLDDPKVQTKTKAAKDWCKSNGFEYNILTEHNLDLKLCQDLAENLQ